VRHIAIEQQRQRLLKPGIDHWGVRGNFSSLSSGAFLMISIYIFHFSIDMKKRSKLCNISRFSSSGNASSNLELGVGMSLS